MPTRRRIITILLGLVLFGWAVFGGYRYFTPPGEDEASARLNAAAMAETYRFDSDCQVIMDGDTRQYFSISGAKAGGDFYFIGTVLGTETSFYLVDGMAYQQSDGSPWRVNELPDIENAVTLFSELDPSSAFDYSSLGGFQYIGVEKTEDGAYFKLIFIPVQQGWVAEYFDQVTYTLWLPRGGQDNFIAEINGLLAENDSVTLRMRVVFYDIDGDIAIEPPQV